MRRAYDAGPAGCTKPLSLGTVLGDAAIGGWAQAPPLMEVSIIPPCLWEENDLVGRDMA